jgi:hypothetical protein
LPKAQFDRQLGIGSINSDPSFWTLFTLVVISYASNSRAGDAD